jgi:outer membrane protein TolC
VVRASIAASPTLVAANATLAQAREEVNCGAWRVSAQRECAAGAQRSGAGAVRAPGAAPPQISTASVCPRATARISSAARGAPSSSSRRSRTYQRNQLAAAYLTLTGSVVNEVLVIASTRLQIATTEELIASDRKNLALTQREFDVGIVPRSDVLTADSQLAADLTQLPRCTSNSIRLMTSSRCLRAARPPSGRCSHSTSSNSRCRGIFP